MSRCFGDHFPMNTDPPAHIDADRTVGRIHNLPPERVHGALHTRPEGLSRREAEVRLQDIGPNTLEERRVGWWLQSLVRQFSNFFTILLVISAGICFVADHIQPGEQMAVLGFALFGVAVLNALFSFFQEYRAERAMQELKKFLPQQVLAMRDGKETEIPADSLVPGDVIVVREGDRIPADARLVESEELTVNNAPLTGESNLIVLDPAESDAALEASRNVVFAGCAVVRGSGRAVVFATGFRSQFGRIAILSREIQHTISPLQRETARMVRVLTIIAVTMGLVFFAYGVLTERSLWVNLVFMMGIIVANVPEGLLPTFTLSLAMASLRMAKRNVLVRTLNAVEALGAVHVICTDKTGTLTENRLSVSRIIPPLDGPSFEDETDTGRILARALETSDLNRSNANRWSGDPLEIAVATRADEIVEEGWTDSVLATVEKRFPFDVAKRYAAAIVKADPGRTFAVKGAWEAVRSFVSEVRGNGGSTRPLTDEVLRKIDRTVDQHSASGFRLIAVAERRLESEVGNTDAEHFAHEMTLLGFIALEDPLRPEVPNAVAECHHAGIRVVMVTGDHPGTAVAIAKRAGIVGDGEDSASWVMTGADLAYLDERDLADRLDDGVRIFARTTPEQKMKIVNAFRQLDRVVAVTGDGVNDAPALKAADVGVAMGRTGTDVAREAAQVILLDDNFASIVAGIEEGRTIFANIRKFTNYVLVSNGPEIVPYLVYMLFPVPLALTVIQILAIDLGTDIIPSMALGQEKPDAETMRQPPRDRNQGLMTWPLITHSYLFLGLIEAAVSLGLFFWVLQAGGWVWGQELASSDPLYRSATGIALSSILLMQVGNLFGRRSRYGLGIDRSAFANPLIVLGILLEVLFSWAILYYPPLGAILGTGPVDLHVYLAAWCGPVLIFGMDYGRKRIARALSERHTGLPYRSVQLF